MNINQLIDNARFTVLLGKNGSGKSTLLRQLDSSDEMQTKYISPERGGSLKYNPRVEHSIFQDEHWLTNDRRKNRTEQFRQQSTAQFRNLEVLVLREIEMEKEKRQDLAYTFDTTLNAINELLPAIALKRADRGFAIEGTDHSPIDEDQVSSGEAELIALAIEVLVFSRESSGNRILLLDEPDVHLHPDLQQKFISFLEAIATEYTFKVAIATHSTAITGAFSTESDLQIAPITHKEQIVFQPFRYSEICNVILPVFGAHPLSSQFNETPVILVEGEDDRRVIDQLVRSSDGRFRFTPCVVGSVDEMANWENWLNSFLPSIYDEPVAFSLRDLDSSTQSEIDDLGCVRRARLNCYAIENLLLTNECLSAYNHTPESFLEALESWASIQPEHPMNSYLNNLIENFDARRTVKVKEVRNILVALLETNKPWEVLIGQLLAQHDFVQDPVSNSLNEFIGADAIYKLFI